VKGQSENNDLSKKFENYTYPAGDKNWDAISAGISSREGGLLDEKFAGYAYEPSAVVWRGIESAIHPSRRRRIAAWWWYGAAASLFFLAYIAYLNSNSAPEQRFAERTEVNLAASDSLKATKVNQETEASGNSEMGSLAASAKAKTETSKTRTPENNADQNNLTDSPDNLKPGSVGVAEVSRKVTFSSAKKDELEMPVYEKREGVDFQKISPLSSSIKWELAAADLAGEFRDAPQALDKQEAKKSTPFYDGTETLPTNEISLLAGSQLAFSGLGNQNEDGFSSSTSGIGGGVGGLNLSESQSYSAPVYYGVNGEIKFWSRWAGGIGLGYLRMQSDSRLNSSQNNFRVNTQRAYLSVPVYLKFNFIDKPKFAVYTSVGHAYDFLIWQQTESFRNGTVTDTNNENKEKVNQANVNAGLGMQFKFTPHIGIFTEGSLMKYYWLPADNFYSQKSLWPGMRFGIVVSF